MKEISIKTINKIKELDLKIFEYEDDDYVNRRGVVRCERAIDEVLKKENLLEYRTELLTIIKWYKNDCATELEKKGWKIKYD